MAEFSLPGLKITIDNDCADGIPAGPLSNLLNDQQQRYGNDALMGWRRICADEGNVNRAMETAAALSKSAQELLLIGMGGSVNGARAVYRALDLRRSVHHTVEFMDNPDPLSMISLLSVIDPDRTSVLAVSRSGNTVETLAMLATVMQYLPAGRQPADGPLTAVCCLPGDNQLAELAARHGWLQHDAHRNIGGRFSVFSAAGLIPLAFSGIDISKLNVVAAEAAEQVEECDLSDNPAWQLSSLLVSSRESVLYSYADVLAGFSDWWKQLIAESSGRRMAKSGSVGITPVIARGTADQHSINQLLLDSPGDRSCCFIGFDDHGFDVELASDNDFLATGSNHLGGLTMSEMMRASLEGTRDALMAEGVGCANIMLERPDERSMASLLQLWHYTTACIGIRLGINPYDQPAVERSKQITAEKLLNRYSQ
ncbi:MAG: hypothetical protein R3F46_07900 [bacterium]